MKVYGDLEKIKTNVKEKYKEMLKKEQKNAVEQKKRIKSETEKQKKLFKKKCREKIVQTINAEKSRILNQKKMDAKKSFEIEREQIINSVLREVEQKAEKILGKKQYYDFVNKNLSTKKFFVRTSLKNTESKIKKALSVKQEKGLKGVIAETDSEVFDFTIPSIMEEKKELLREIIAKELFGGQ